MHTSRALGTLLLLSITHGAVPPNRHADPVVLKGPDVPELFGQNPGLVVGFRFDEEITWEQVPVQIDELHMAPWLRIKQGDCRLIGKNLYGQVWADAGTYSGPDEDPFFDEDDEFVFMARHLGSKRPPGFLSPPGTLSGFEVELEIQDPLLAEETIGYFYIFLSDGTLQPDANAPLVEYKLNLLNTNDQGSNDYFDAYNFECEIGGGPIDRGYECKEKGPKNPEDSWFKSPFYERHFAENWFSDELKIKAGGATGENFVNTQDFQFLLFDCSRCVYSFTHSVTAFVINKSGPVRAMRSWVGANSGTITQRELHMYEQREDQVTYLRVHTIPGIFDYMVYKPGTYMTYYNCHNQQGIPIDGVPDENFNRDFCTWEVVQGPTGTYLRTIDIMHDFGDWAHYPNFDPSLVIQHWFYDNEVPTCTDCGDKDTPKHPNGWHMCSARMTNYTAAWGSHGIISKPPYIIIFNTDPARHILQDDLPPDACPVEVIEPWLFHFNVTNRQYFLSPDADPLLGEQYYLGSVTPLSRK